MNRFGCALALALGLTACGSGDGLTGELSDSSAAELIRKGDPKACAHPEVKERILSTIFVKPEPFQGNIAQDGNRCCRRHYYDVTDADIEAVREQVGEPTLADFQAVEVDPQVGEVTCVVSATKSFFISGGRTPRGDSYPPKEKVDGYTVQYVLRQSLEADDDFLMTTGPFAMMAMLVSGDWRARADELAKSRLPADILEQQFRETDTVQQTIDTQSRTPEPTNSAETTDAELEQEYADEIEANQDQ